MDVRLPDGTVIQNVPDGMTKADLITKLKGNGYDTSSLDPAVKAGQVINKSIDSIPRQLGLTARYGMEGMANTAQLVTEPIRAITDRLGGTVGKTKPVGALASDFADWMGLPKPSSPTERVIGDASRLVAGTGATMGLGGAAQKGGEIAKNIGGFFTQNPISQISSAAGAGLAGGASREAGGSEMGQVLASVAGGVGGASLAGLGQGLATQASKLKNTFMTPQQMDVKISEVLRQSGVDYSQVPERTRQALRAELADALRSEKDLNPQAVARLADFQSSGLTPTRGMLTLDPVQITREQNLAKIGANSADGQLQGLARVQNQNNAKLISNMNDLGALRGDTQRAGEAVAGSVLGTQAGLRGAEQAAWDAAKNSPGYRAPISSRAISDINQALGDEGLMPFMSPAVSKYMEAFQTGQPFTPQSYRNLQSMLAREVSKGGNEGAAASLAQRVLHASDLTPAGLSGPASSLVPQGLAAGMRQADNSAADAISAVNSARGATRAAYAFEDSNPLVRSVLSGSATSDPQRIASRFILGGTSNEAADLVNQLGPQGLAPIKEAILADLKSKALSGSADEVGKFSQSAFNKGLSAIGDRKLSLLFSPEELQALRTNARAASYMQFQPIGSAVNNSNSGALLFGRGLDLLDKIPMAGPWIAPPIRNIQVSMGNRSAQNVAQSLLLRKPPQPFINGLLAPGVAIGGLLAAPASP